MNELGPHRAFRAPAFPSALQVSLGQVAQLNRDSGHPVWFLLCNIVPVAHFLYVRIKMQSGVSSSRKPGINASSPPHPLLLVRLCRWWWEESVALAALGRGSEKSYLEQKGGEREALARPAHAPGSVPSVCWASLGS